MGSGCGNGEWGMVGDADFEHARLLKIHTSVVVSARSVKGFYGFGPLVYYVMPCGNSGVSLYITVSS